MDVNQKYTNLLNEQIAKIGKECRYLEFKSNYQEVDKLGRYTLRRLCFLIKYSVISQSVTKLSRN